MDDKVGAGCRRALPRPPQREAGHRTHPGTASLFPPEGGGREGTASILQVDGETKGSCQRKKCLGGVWKVRRLLARGEGGMQLGRQTEARVTCFGAPGGPGHTVCTADLSPADLPRLPSHGTNVSVTANAEAAHYMQSTSALILLCTPTGNGTRAPEANLPPNTRTQSPPCSRPLRSKHLLCSRFQQQGAHR